MQDSYNIYSLWQQGDTIIRSIAIILLSMSLFSWTLILIRSWFAISQAKDATRIRQFWSEDDYEKGLTHLPSTMPSHALALQAKAAMHHYATSQNPHLLSADAWLSECLQGSLDQSNERQQTGLSTLASVAATAPFIGLFGTVWGIYHALITIAQTGQASIDKITGPVGEALIMTAFGLAVAIPAVLAYNAFTQINRRRHEQLNHFARQLHAYFMTGAKYMHTI